MLIECAVNAVTRWLMVFSIFALVALVSCSKNDSSPTPSLVPTVVKPTQTPFPNQAPPVSTQINPRFPGTTPNTLPGAGSGATRNPTKTWPGDTTDSSTDKSSDSSDDSSDGKHPRRHDHDKDSDSVSHTSGKSGAIIDRMSGVDCTYDENGSLLNPSCLKASEIFAKNASSNDGEGTGAQSIRRGQLNLISSSSGQDRYLEDLRKKLSSEADGSQKAKNMRLANRLGFTTFAVDADHHTATVHIELLDGLGHYREFNLEGQYDSNGRIATVGRTDTFPYVRASLECMDRSSTDCSEAIIKISHYPPAAVSGDKDAADCDDDPAPETGTPALSYVIARNTQAYLFAKGKYEPGSSPNASYNRLMSFFVNSVDHPCEIGSLGEVRLLTSETVFGKSLFQVTLKFLQGDASGLGTSSEILAFNGQMLKDRQSNETRVMILDANHNSVTVVGGKADLSSSFNRSIKTIEMVKNDGHGDLQFQFVLQASNSEDENLSLTVARIHPAVKRGEVRTQAVLTATSK